MDSDFINEDKLGPFLREAESFLKKEISYSIETAALPDIQYDRLIIQGTSNDPIIRSKKIENLVFNLKEYLFHYLGGGMALAKTIEGENYIFLGFAGLKIIRDINNALSIKLTGIHSKILWDIAKISFVEDRNVSLEDLIEIIKSRKISRETMEEVLDDLSKMKVIDKLGNPKEIKLRETIKAHPKDWKKNRK